MDFNLQKQEHNFRLALYPESLRELSDDFKNLKSFVYIIQKKFNPYDNEKKLNLFKVGYSSIEGKSIKSGLTRLLGFRTVLISFKVHRFYHYLNSQRPTKGDGESSLAHDAEQILHEEISKNFKPKHYRLKFSNDRNKLNI